MSVESNNARMRAQFEDHFTERGWDAALFVRTDKGYRNESVQVLWTGWLAHAVCQPLHEAGALEVATRLQNGEILDLNTQAGLREWLLSLPLSAQAGAQVEPENIRQHQLLAKSILWVMAVMVMTVSLLSFMNSRQMTTTDHWQAHARTRTHYPDLKNEFEQFDQCYDHPELSAIFENTFLNAQWEDCMGKVVPKDPARFQAFRAETARVFDEMEKRHDGPPPPMQQ
jgi:hypothetical protein